MQLPALDVLATVREEDSLNVEGAYLEGWAFHLRAETLQAEQPTNGDTNAATVDEEGGVEKLTAGECLSESMTSLLECAKLFSEQEYPDEGIGKHVQELLEDLEKKGVKPAVDETGEVETVAEDGNGDWQDAEGQNGDVEMS